MDKQVKRPIKIAFVSQRQIDEKNRSTREQVLRIFDELRSVKHQIAVGREDQR